jgi:hypothetical protein
MLNKIWPILEPTLPKSSPFIVAWDILIKVKRKENIYYKNGLGLID